MFVVLSFDYGNTDTVKVHAIVHDRLQAEEMYEEVAVLARRRNLHKDCQILVELQEFPDDFLNADGMSFFWVKP